MDVTLRPALVINERDAHGHGGTERFVRARAVLMGGHEMLA
jgi:hypothetical protein